MEESSLPTGDALNEEITDALVAVYTRYFGYGPASATTLRHDNVVVTLLRNVLSKAERVVAQNGGKTEVGATRDLYRREMEGDCRAVVERLTGRAVVAFIGASQLEEDMAAEIFVLDGAARNARGLLA